MTYDVVFTRKAQRQIQAAARWWAEHRSAEQAQRWYQGLIETLSSLEENPQRCAMAQRPLVHSQPKAPGSMLQSRNATDAIALERFSVFISTRCQPSSRMVAWSGWVILPRT